MCTQSRTRVDWNDACVSGPADFTPSFDALRTGRGELPRCRGKLGLSQAELARDTEVADSHISNLESGKANPTLGLLVQLADGLNCTMPDLLEGS